MHSIYRFRARLATVLSLRPLCFSVESSRSAGESDGLQIKGIAQNSCRTRFDAHSKRGTESSNPPPSSGESGELPTRLGPNLRPRSTATTRHHPRRRRRIHPSLWPLRQCQPGRQYRIGPPAPRRTRPSLVKQGQRRHRKSSPRQRVQRLSLLRRADDHRRGLRTRLPAPLLARPLDRARQLMSNTLLSPFPSLRLSDDDIPPATATLCRWHPQPRPRPPKPRSFSTPARGPRHARQAKSPTPLPTQAGSSVRERTSRAQPRLKSP